LRKDLDLAGRGVQRILLRIGAKALQHERTPSGS
jgi:hypothetical protein